MKEELDDATRKALTGKATEFVKTIEQLVSHVAKRHNNDLRSLIIIPV